MVKELVIKPCDLEALRLTVSYDNHEATQEGLQSAWGFSCLIEGLEAPILFDSGGDPKILRANMDALGIDLDCIRDVVLSHQHWDHVNGIELFNYLPEGRRIHLPGPCPYDLSRKIQALGIGVNEVAEPDVMAPGAYSTGPMGRGVKEHSLLIPTRAGTIVITGCAHPGPVAIVKRARKIVRQEVLLLIGGFHLMDMGALRLKRIVGNLFRLGVRYVAPGHCTGDDARDCFKEIFGSRYLGCQVGWRLANARILAGPE